MVKCLRVTDLSSVCSTRKRGLEAWENLKRHLGADSIEIDLGNVDIVSFSFLDELIRQIVAGKVDPRGIIFKASDPAVMDKLERVAAIRHVSFQSRSDGQLSQIVPKPPLSSRTTFVSEKPALV